VNLDTIEITIDVSEPPPATILRWSRFGLGLLWTTFTSIAVDNLYLIGFFGYKTWKGENVSWSVFLIAFVNSILVLRTYWWFQRKSGKDDLTPRQRWTVCSRLMVFAYEHGIEIEELLPWVRGLRLLGKGRFSYAHFNEWHRASLVCRFGMRWALNDLVKRIGQEATERTIRRNGSLLLAIAKAAR